ncbi:MAG: NUDIX hydrolase [Armatimonadetes bacterium]|nr:MAG: NUDIX hydrolase [Armatimonadota bacterium]
MRTVKRSIVSALILSFDNKILMGRKDREDGGVYPDCWHIPGGGIDEGESKFEALRREMMEEIGVDISGIEVELVNEDEGTAEGVIKKTGEKVLFEMDFSVYKIILDKKCEDTEVRLSDDLVEYDWFDLSSLKDLKLPPPSVTLFKKLGYLE